MLNTATGTSNQTPPATAAAAVVVPPQSGPGIVKKRRGPVTIGDRIDYRPCSDEHRQCVAAWRAIGRPHAHLDRDCGCAYRRQAQVYTGSYGPVTESDPLVIANTAVVTGITPAGQSFGPVTGTFTVTVVPQADLQVSQVQ